MQIPCYQVYYKITELPLASDVNECKDGSHSCRLNQMCVNTVGSFYCLCPRGYSAVTADAPCEGEEPPLQSSPGELFARVHLLIIMTTLKMLNSLFKNRRESDLRSCEVT